MTKHPESQPRQSGEEAGGQPSSFWLGLAFVLVLAAALAENSVQPLLMEKYAQGEATSLELLCLRFILNHIGNATEALYLFSVFVFLNCVLFLAAKNVQGTSQESRIKGVRQGLQTVGSALYLLAVFDAETSQHVIRYGTPDPLDIPFSLFSLAAVVNLSRWHWSHINSFRPINDA